jgi:DNA-binding response OmpR family regulator
VSSPTHAPQPGDYRDAITAVEVLIGRLRKKLGVDLIETRRSFGYVIPSPALP